MSRSYIKAAEEYLQGIDVVFDRFHIMQLVTRAVDEIRKEQCRRLKIEEREIFKGNRFLFLRNYDELSPVQEEQLSNLLFINFPLFQAYTMKEQLRAFWMKSSLQDAAKFLFDWLDGARLTGLDPFIRLASTLEKHLSGIINYFKHRISNGKAEGINNKIKTLKRQAYGYRDMGYFKLRLYHLHVQKSRLCG